MRTIRGLQITSLVVLSPILLVMISLVSILVASIYSSIYAWLFQTTLTIPQQITIGNDVISIPHQRNLNNKQMAGFKRIQQLFRLRKSPLTWMFLLLLYAGFILFKKTKHGAKQPLLSPPSSELVDIHDTIPPEPAKPITKKRSTKRRRTKKVTSAINERRQRPRSTTISSTTSSLSDANTVHIKEEQDEDQAGDWISVSKKQHQKPHKEEEEEEEDKVHVNSNKRANTITTTHHHSSYPSPTFSCNSTQNDNNNNKHHFDINLYSPEATPVHSEDEESIEKKPGNWYSPFSTGLDLDILPKHHNTTNADPLCLYKFNFNYNIPNHPLRSSFHPPLSSIQMLENHPFISLSKSSKTHHAFGPIGHKITL